MRIGTITFHWAANYGAVLQAYALQKCLVDDGYETEIINYIPARIDFITKLLWIRNNQFYEFRKLSSLQKFIKKHMRVSAHKYKNNSSLFKAGGMYDAVICGSDQIWNEGFTLHAEKKETLSYFLNFLDEKTKRIAYAVSFGSTEVSEKYINAVKPELKKFCAISVRENTGLDLCKQLSVNASLVCDPTLLIQSEDYDTLIDKAYSKESIYKYILHDDKNTSAVAEYVKNTSHDVATTGNSYSLEEWLYKIKYADIVVTNSFHGIALSLIFNTPFIPVIILNSGMNDRIFTLLSYVGLTDRIIEDAQDTAKIGAVMQKKINWDSVNARLYELRMSGKYFLDQALSN